MWGQGLMSYLILPVQRLPRYVILLRELQKHTPKEDTDSLALISQALQKVLAEDNDVHAAHNHTLSVVCRQLCVQSIE